MSTPSGSKKIAAGCFWGIGMVVLVVLGISVLLPSTKRSRIDPEELERLRNEFRDDEPASMPSTSPATRPVSLPERQ